MDEPRRVTVHDEIDRFQTDRCQVFEFGRPDPISPGQQRLEDSPLGRVVDVIERVEIGLPESPPTRRRIGRRTR